MKPDDKPRTITTTEVRQGQTVNMTRWVLIFGLALVVPALVLAWLFTRG
ncbi:hypothetical protein [Sediminicoccus rosea]|uniref:Uncharacterized protein n=1 Tax=Sediminicoccus rosea TaxID=1225128 RepID=A0ABZ0PL44_9PROT|nr:hypothetical protein [Sediminicoccus rosea]WPB86156.1 hypothetical protein R9Z33_04615 [Sediminicoccus rosea]